MQGLLPDDLNIYVITSTNPSELGWATYCPDMNPPPPPEYDVCLGDLFSVSWMEDRYIIYASCFYIQWRMN